MGEFGRRFLLSVTPPLLMRAARAAKRKVAPGRPTWEVIPGGWETVRRRGDIRGWDVRSAVEASVQRAQTLVTANLAEHLPFGASTATVDSPMETIEFHNTAESFVHAFLSSTRTLSRASVLDWGGGVGQYSEICRAVAPNLVIDYHCCDLPEFVQRGRELYPELTFHDDGSWASQTYDFVFSSSSLHYVEDWSAQLRALAVVAKGRRLFITRIPLVFRTPSFVFVQRPYAWGFGTEYAAWCFNRHQFLEQAHRLGLRTVWEFVTGERAEIVGVSEVSEFRGFLFDVPADFK